MGKSMWELTDELVKKHDQAGGSWLKLNDGGKAVVVFLGEPFPREVVFKGGKYEAYSEEHKKEGLSPTVRVMFNVAMLATGELKILEQSIGFYKDLCTVKAK